MSEQQQQTEAPQQALTPYQQRSMQLREGIGEHEPVAIVPRTFAEVQAFASAISQSSLVPTAMRDNAPNVAMIILAGAEIGIPPIASLRVFHVIEGVPKLSADGIAAICMRDPSCEYIEPSAQSTTSVTWRAKKRGRPEVTLTLTREDMNLAGLYDRKNRDGSPGNHQKYPRQMLNARCKAELCRVVWPDICAGMLSSEEASDIDAIDAEFTEIKSTTFAPLPSAPAPTPLVVDPNSDFARDARRGRPALVNEERAATSPTEPTPATEPTKRTGYSDDEVLEILADMSRAKDAAAVTALADKLDKPVLTDAQYKQLSTSFKSNLSRVRTKGAA